MSTTTTEGSTRRIVSAGLVHEYKHFELVAHVEAQIAFLERLDPVAGAEVRALADQHARLPRGFLAKTREIQAEVNSRFDRIAPSGLYYGAPSAQSNLRGFWPTTWIEGSTPRNPKGVSDLIARQLGDAVIS